jgi:hypothetical protein
MGEIGKKRAVEVEDLRADGHGEHDVLAVPAATASALAVPARTGGVAGLPPVPPEIAEIGVGHHDDVAAVAAVTAVRTALRNVLLAPEADGAVPAATAAGDDAGAILEHDLRGRPPPRPERPR